jgi:galactose mutarotase-like enzyme
MPYSIGLHPGFVWPFCGGDYSDDRIVFDQQEAPSVPIVAPGGLFSQTSRAIALTGRELALSPELFAHEALCFINAKSRKLTFELAGFGAIEIASEGFPHWALWSKPGAPFLCIEAWSGHGDPEDFAGELRDKPSITLLASGGEGVHKARLSFRSS